MHPFIGLRLAAIPFVAVTYGYVAYHFVMGVSHALATLIR
jgi:hypothetical protein